MRRVGLDADGNDWNAERDRGRRVSSFVDRCSAPQTHHGRNRLFQASATIITGAGGGVANLTRQQERIAHVCFTPKSGHRNSVAECPLCAMCGRLRVGKGNLHVAALVGACVRPVCALHMTAGHNALRGSGPGQKDAFNDALARVGCPDRRIDRLCFTCCSPFQLSHHAIRGAISLDLQRRRIIVPRARSHHCPSHSRKLVGKRDRRNFGRPSRQ